MKKTVLMICAISFLLSVALVAPVQAQPENWKVLCHKDTKVITLTKDHPAHFPKHIVLKQFFPSEPAARQWVQANHPSWKCP
ncbi:MAG: hypothetical protein JXR96_08865 [Deltaproteobacteria bacterium]|nr:hypothetical protein [Deltaproteobacteria bacterium]